MKLKDPTLSPFVASILSLFAWFMTVIVTIGCYTGGLFFVMPFSLLLDSGKRRLMHGVAQCWGKTLIATSPVWKFRVEGMENIQPGRHYVVVSNHQSMIDILIVLAGLPLHFKFMAKKELFSVPFLGWHMILAGYIPIDRGSPNSGKKALAEADRWLSKGVSVLMFPEGTRTPHGEVQDFRPGAFKLAQVRDVEVLPVVLDGTWDAVPKKSWRIKKISSFDLRILKPIKINSAEEVDAKRKEIRQRIIKALSELRKDRIENPLA